MEIKEPYEPDSFAGSANKGSAGEDERPAMQQISVPMTSQRPVSALGWGLALAIGTLAWILLYLVVRS